MAEEASSKLSVDSPDSTSTPTPPKSRSSSSSSLSSRRQRTPSLSLDLSDLPPLIQPSPPSNTLIITNLRDPTFFAPAALARIRDLITRQLPAHDPADPSATPADIHSLAPLPSLSRIIISFTTIAAAQHIRELLDGAALLDTRIRVYFGAQTRLVAPASQHLAAPKSQKLFFISPPPSPPHGWEMRNEEPPNKEVHAADLARELERISARRDPIGFDVGSGTDQYTQQKEHAHDKEDSSADGATGLRQSGHSKRRRASSTIVFRPEDQGASPDLPSIAVEDLTSNEYHEEEDESEERERKILAHTARPPVELMLD